MSMEMADAILSEAYINGRKLGLEGRACALVQGEMGSAEHTEGLRGWKNGAATRAYQDAMQCAA